MRVVVVLAAWAPLVAGPVDKTNGQAPADDKTRDEVKKLGGKFLIKGYKASWSPSGKRLVFGIPANYDGSEGIGLAVYDLKSRRATNLVKGGKDPAWSAGDDLLIAYVIGYVETEAIWVIDPTGEKPRKVADGGYPSWSADGKSLFYHAHTTGKLMAMPVGPERKFGEPQEVLDTPFYYPAISWDGKRVAVRDGQQAVILERGTGKRLHTFGLPPGRGFLAGWSPDGKRIVFGGYGFYDPVPCRMVDVESGRTVQVAAGPVTCPAFTKDGSKLAVDLRMQSGFEIWLLEAKALDTLKPAEVEQ
jgi:Tol biopolymer transport system component